MTEPTTAGQGLKKTRWKLHDLIDLEYFLHRPDHDITGNDVLNSTRTDRDIFLAHLQQSVDPDRPLSRRLLVKGWLDVRRNEENGPLPGAIFKEIYRVALMCAVLLGIAFGIGLALSLLDYRGAEPLNVSVYLGVAVFSQILLLLLLAALFCLRAAGRSLVRRSLLAGLLGRMLTRAALKARHQALNHIGGEKREAVAAAAGLFRGRSHVYGSLFFWPVFKIVQTFAVCVNLGLLGATLLRLTGTDVAFGWQSTLQVSPEVVLRIVETMALPWRELLPGIPAHPSLAQIEGSRIILKDGMNYLATGNLVSWWPFLCLSVFFYGLLPRVLLMTTGTVVQSRLLSRLRFDHGDCDALVRRMISPVVDTAGRPQAAFDHGAPQSSEPSRSVSTAAGSETIPRVVALIPEEIFDASEGLESTVHREMALHVTDRIKIGADLYNDQVVFDFLKVVRENAENGGVLVLFEAWQPPIREVLSFLEHLRREIGDTGRIVVGLIGKPDAETIFTPVRDRDLNVWKRSIDALGDPYLQVERLLTHGN